MNIIDFHMHPFISKEDNLCFYKNVLENTYEHIVSDMQLCGISRFCGSVIKRPFSGFETLHACNVDALEIREKFGDTYIPGVQISPQFLEESVNELIFAHENGIALIGELVPYMHGEYTYYSNEFSEILKFAEKFSMTVSLHTMAPEFENIRKTVKLHKHVNFVMAHPGERDTVNKHIELMKECDNVYLDISGTGILRYGMLTNVVRAVGAERVLFGTDYPIGHPKLYIDSVLTEKLTDNEKELIFCKNAQKLLCL